ncbi:MAG: hypothetical protein JW944_12165 [Deltaproteobacteria bacterium]|nr:hypothetical protein [Deltaproteobacteria bacterium]
MTKKIPVRPIQAMTGTEFVRYVQGMDRAQREQAISEQLLKGNLPEFLRMLKPVQLDFLSGKARFTATIFVMPDYLSIGSSRDFLRIPMNLYTATRVARRFGFLLPTQKMVDAIYSQSDYRLKPEPMTPGPRMGSTDYFFIHNLKIRKERLAMDAPLGGLLSGHKKDVVATNRLFKQRGRIAIYGWHRPNGIPIQPLSTVHGARYVDYSHGIRLISETVLINGTPHSLYDALSHPQYSTVLCAEGPILSIREIMDLDHEERIPETFPAGILKEG